MLSGGCLQEWAGRSSKAPRDRLQGPGAAGGARQRRPSAQPASQPASQPFHECAAHEVQSAACDAPRCVVNADDRRTATSRLPPGTTACCCRLLDLLLVGAGAAARRVVAMFGGARRPEEALIKFGNACVWQGKMLHYDGVELAVFFASALRVYLQ